MTERAHTCSHAEPATANRTQGAGLAADSASTGDAVDLSDRRLCRRPRCIACAHEDGLVRPSPPLRLDTRARTAFCSSPTDEAPEDLVDCSDSLPATPPRLTRRVSRLGAVPIWRHCTTNGRRSYHASASRCAVVSTPGRSSATSRRSAYELNVVKTNRSSPTMFTSPESRHTPTRRRALITSGAILHISDLCRPRLDPLLARGRVNLGAGFRRG